MDIVTMIGILTVILITLFGLTSGEIPSVIFNLHAVVFVFGGTIIATLLATPKRYILKSISNLKMVLLSSIEEKPEEIIPYMVELADKARKTGLKSLKDIDEKKAGGFIRRAFEVAIEYGDTQFVRKVLEQEINNNFDELNESGNVYRTMSLLSPMFGLIGTLVGIIGVLKELSNPQSVGSAMAVAITSAFYGILLSNLVFIPFAGKIRGKSIMRLKLKSMILEGVLEIMNGSVPVMVERRLRSFIEE